jgi:hypothetical protein
MLIKQKLSSFLEKYFLLKLFFPPGSIRDWKEMGLVVRRMIAEPG